MILMGHGPRKQKHEHETRGAGWEETKVGKLNCSRTRPLDCVMMNVEVTSLE